MTTEMITTYIEARYVSRKKLRELLDTLFGDDYNVVMAADTIAVEAIRQLTEGYATTFATSSGITETSRIHGPVASRPYTTKQQITMPNPISNLKVEFAHEQHVHHLKGKLHHALCILANTASTLVIIAEHELSIMHSLGLTSHTDDRCLLRNMSRDVDGYQETARKLLRMFDDLQSMYGKILALRGQELQHDASLKLAQLAQANAAESQNMVLLADSTYKDSRAMRIATAIAMLYLPVNLVMSFFSSTLVVWYETATEADRNSTMRIRREEPLPTAVKFPISESTAQIDTTKLGIDLASETRRTLRELAASGVDDEDNNVADVRWCGEVGRVMRIDFDRAYLQSWQHSQTASIGAPETPATVDVLDAMEETEKEASARPAKRAKYDSNKVAVVDAELSG
ncbi:hypothetical protein CMQ_4149 [Grosmannia clavigera kw1407]|uniref:Uncharacterized protein n=1 Tax=Grosmannia clavigera (strain kw1407 / UAMH 11150) TaxID=655863 RepID=F0X9C8_GROCL|nr:uncharacterized protein CMQ_4149 [Grosmannia clavigera kw1407]EFX06080.1 hypothetical protein CMQ_4149 [Grosmannia clavigera kw1407]